jgi:hypothetical protein
MEFRRWCTSGDVAECSIYSAKSTFVAPFERHGIQMEFQKWCSSGEVAECSEVVLLRRSGGMVGSADSGEVAEVLTQAKWRECSTHSARSTFVEPLHIF